MDKYLYINKIKQKYTYNKFKEAFWICQMQNVTTYFVLYNMIISDSSVKKIKFVSTVMYINIIYLHPPTWKNCTRSPVTYKYLNLIDSWFVVISMLF